ncbi:hypothetical protein INR49_029997 [Caranx melampygus]|nr:hypothetical protein INR49_029997 [Caranx melampygus]
MSCTPPTLHLLNGDVRTLTTDSMALTQASVSPRGLSRAPNPRQEAQRSLNLVEIGLIDTKLQNLVVL